MTGNLQMGDTEIRDFKQYSIDPNRPLPPRDTALSAGLLSDIKMMDTIRNATIDVKTNEKENFFSFVMDEGLLTAGYGMTKVGKVGKDFYHINKETYEFTVNYNSNSGYYSGGLTIVLKKLDVSFYTLVFETIIGRTAKSLTKLLYFSGRHIWRWIPTIPTIFPTVSYSDVTFP